MRLRTSAVLLACLALTACSGGGDPTVAAASPSVEVPSAGVTPSASAPVEQGSVVLRGDGLDVTTAGTVKEFRFGQAARAELEGALAGALGAPLQEQGVACGQGARTALGADGFDVLLEGDVLRGWDAYPAEGVELVTDSGLRLGSTRAEVEAALPGAEFSESSLGPEFSSPSGLAGFLDGSQPTSQVVGLTGGEQCVVR